jgi:glycine cleavage system regulatory protein
MKVFISWSKPLSKKVAESLSDWLQSFPLVIEPWVSGPDIDPGTRWNNELSEALEDTNFGIICITKDNQKAPWICFEAGALSKTIEKSRVVPYLIDIRPEQLEHPLKQFQAVEANKTGTLKLLMTLFKVAGNINLSETKIIRTFEKWWPDLEKEIETAKNEASEPNIPGKELSLQEIKSSLDLAIELLESLSTRSVIMAKLADVIYSKIIVVTKNKPGIIAKLTSVIQSLGANISRSTMKIKGRHYNVSISLQVIDNDHLNTVIEAVEKVEDVISVLIPVG